MATSKPKTTKTAAKKPTKPSVRNKTKVVSKKISAPSARSFRVSSAARPFMTFSITRDTVYWLILSLAVLALGAWVINLQVSINKIYDKIEQEQVASDLLDQRYMQAIQKKKAQSMQ